MGAGRCEMGDGSWERGDMALKQLESTGRVGEKRSVAGVSGRVYGAALEKRYLRRGLRVDIVNDGVRAARTAELPEPQTPEERNVRRVNAEYCCLAFHRSDNETHPRKRRADTRHCSAPLPTPAGSLRSTTTSSRMTGGCSRRQYHMSRISSSLVGYVAWFYCAVTGFLSQLTPTHSLPHGPTPSHAGAE